MRNTLHKSCFFLLTKSDLNALFDGVCTFAQSLITLRLYFWCQPKMLLANTLALCH